MENVARDISKHELFGFSILKPNTIKHEKLQQRTDVDTWYRNCPVASPELEWVIDLLMCDFN